MGIYILTVNTSKKILVWFNKTETFFIHFFKFRIGVKNIEADTDFVDDYYTPQIRYIESLWQVQEIQTLISNNKGFFNISMLFWYMSSKRTNIVINLKKIQMGSQLSFSRLNVSLNDFCLHESTLQIYFASSFI